MSVENKNMKKSGLYLLHSARQWVLVLFGIFLVTLAPAQSLEEENKKIARETNKLLRSAEDNLSDNDFASAEASYREAVAKSPDNVKAKYNMANMYYGKEKPSQAASRLIQASRVAETKEDKHKIYHNLGNSFMVQKRYKEAVEAYKNALRNNPKDEETRYNYALAKKMMEENPESGGGKTSRIRTRIKPIRKTAMKASRSRKKEREIMKSREEIQMKILRNNPGTRMKMENQIPSREKGNHSLRNQNRDSFHQSKLKVYWKP